MLLLSPILIKIQTKQKCKTFLEMIFMTDMKLRKLVLAALFAALCTVMTMVIQVPSPMQGYVNLGDCAVLLSAWVLGPWYGGAAAGLGSMLATCCAIRTMPRHARHQVHDGGRRGVYF